MNIESYVKNNNINAIDNVLNNISKKKYQHQIYFILCIACRYANFEVIQLMICYGASINTPFDVNNRDKIPPILYACGFMHDMLRFKYRDNYRTDNVTYLYLETTKLLLDNGADINAKSAKGYSTIHCASSLGNGSKNQKNNFSKLVSFLIKRGCNVNERTHKDITPIHIAAKFNNIAVIRILLKNGADINAIDHKGYNAIHYAAGSNYRHNKNLVTLLNFLINQGCNLHHNYKTTMHLAIDHNNSNLIRVLVANGINIKDKSGYNVLFYAASVKKKNAIKTLLQLGADINARDNLGNTILHYTDRSTRCVKYLLKCGINQWIKNNKGYTPFHIIMQKYKTAVIKFNNNGNKHYRGDCDMYKNMAEILLDHREAQICEWRPWNHCNEPPPYRKAMVCLCLLAKIYNNNLL